MYKPTLISFPCHSSLNETLMKVLIVFKEHKSKYKSHHHDLASTQLQYSPLLHSYPITIPLPSSGRVQLLVPHPPACPSDRDCSTVWWSLSRLRQPRWTSHTLPQHKSFWPTKSSRAQRRRKLKAKGTSTALLLMMSLL